MESTYRLGGIIILLICAAVAGFFIRSTSETPTSRIGLVQPTTTTTVLHQSEFHMPSVVSTTGDDYHAMSDFIPPQYTVRAVLQAVLPVERDARTYPDIITKSQRTVVILSPISDASGKTSSLPLYVLVLEGDSLGQGTYALVGASTHLLIPDTLSEHRFTVDSVDDDSFTVSDTSWGEHATYAQVRSYLFIDATSGAIMLRSVNDRELTATGTGYHVDQVVTLTPRDFGAVSLADIDMSDTQSEHSIREILDSKIVH